MIHKLPPNWPASVVDESCQKSLEHPGLLFALGSERLEQFSRGGVIAADEPGGATVRVDGEALGQEVFLQHARERATDLTVDVPAFCETAHAEVGAP